MGYIMHSRVAKATMRPKERKEGGRRKREGEEDCNQIERTI